MTTGDSVNLGQVNVPPLRLHFPSKHVLKTDCLARMPNRRNSLMKKMGKMKTFRRHWLPFVCGKRPGPRRMVQGGLEVVGRAVPSVGPAAKDHQRHR